MRKSLQIGTSLLLLALAAPVASQSPRADISWLAGGHLSPVSSVAYSPDGTMLASSGFFGDTLKLWRASDGSMIRTFGNISGSSFIFGPMEPVTFLPDGRTIIAIGEGATIGVWNVADGKLLRTISLQGSDVARNGDGTLLALAANSLIKLVRMSDGVVVRSIAWPADSVQRVAFSPDGTVVAGGDRVGTLRTFRVADGAPLLSIKAHTNSIHAVRYSPDGTRIATGSSDQTVKLWNSTTGSPLGTLGGHTSVIRSIAFSPDGTLLASGSNDNTVRLWALPSGAFLATLNQPTKVNSVNFNASSTRLAVACDSELREWDVPTRTLLRNLTRANNQISGTVFSPDSTRVVSGSHDGKLSVHDAVTGALLRQLTPGGNIFTTAASADTIAAGINVPNVIKLYRLSDGELLRTLDPGFQAFSRSAAFSPDGATLATGHLGNFVRLWNVADGSLLRTLGGTSGDLNSIAYTSDSSRLVTASSDGFVRVWDPQGILLRSMGPAGTPLRSCAISPDNQFVLAGGQNGLLQLWRIDTGASVYSFTSSGSISKVRFVPSGFAFYAGRTDGSLQNNTSVRVYRTSDHALLETYSLEAGGFGSSPSGPISLDVSADGKYFSYGRDDATVVTSYNTLIAAPTAASLFRGELVQGSFQDLVMADGMALVVRPGATGDRAAPVQIDIRAQSSVPNPTRLSFQIVVSANIAGIQQETWMQNMQTGALELVDTRPATTTDQSTRIDLGSNFARFIDASGNLMARVKWSPLSQTGTRTWQVSVNQAVWAAGL